MTEQQKKQELHKIAWAWSLTVVVIGSILSLVGIFAILLSSINSVAKYFLLLLVTGMGLAATATLATYVAGKTNNNQGEEN